MDMDKALSGMGRLTLNPNAAEFIPAARRPSTEASGLSTQTKALSRTDSDDERRQYWKDQLPDDIIPDFRVEAQPEDERSGWEHSYGDKNGMGFLNELVGDTASQFAGEGSTGPLDFLVNQFPGFAAESLADILSANGGDLTHTFEMLTQLELQDDVAAGRQLHIQAPRQSRPPSLSLGDFPILAGSDFGNGAQQSDSSLTARTQRTISVKDIFTSRPYSSDGGFGSPTATDFAAAVRKKALASPAQAWEQDRSGHTQRVSHTGDFPANSGEKLGSVYGRGRQSAPVWLETGDAVSNMYTDLREEARDHARVRNAYFEQARQAYLSGNRALARDLSTKGQLHNSLMKEAHNKAGEAIFQQRNVAVGSALHGQPQILDLHGLHVSEAIPLLKRELGALRATARSSHRRMQVLICVGTGHHTKGSRTPARLPVAVEKFLAEEHLVFTEQQPGMLMVVLS